MLDFIEEAMLYGYGLDFTTSSPFLTFYHVSCTTGCNVGKYALVGSLCVAGHSRSAGGVPDAHWTVAFWGCKFAWMGPLQVGGKGEALLGHKQC